MLSLDATWRHKQLTKIANATAIIADMCVVIKIAKLEPVLIDPTSL